MIVHTCTIRVMRLAILQTGKLVLIGISILSQLRERFQPIQPTGLLLLKVHLESVVCKAYRVYKGKRVILE